MAEADTEAVELTGRLLLGAESRLRALEEQQWMLRSQLPAGKAH